MGKFITTDSEILQDYELILQSMITNRCSISYFNFFAEANLNDLAAQRIPLSDGVSLKREMTALWHKYLAILRD